MNSQTPLAMQFLCRKPVSELDCKLTHKHKFCKRRIRLVFEKEAKLNQAQDSSYWVFSSVLQLQDTLKTGKEEKELLTEKFLLVLKATVSAF